MKKFVQTLSLIVVFIFSLKFFQSTPFEAQFFQFQAVFLGLILVFLMFYIAASLFNKGRHPNAIVWYFLILIAVIPFLSAYRASAEFGQPFIYGFLSERGWLIVGVGVWFYNVIIKEKITISTVESAFVIMAWASLLFFSLFILSYDPSQLQGSYSESKMVHATQDRGLRFTFQLYFITFGSIYYLVKYTTYRRPKDVVLLLAFLAYVMFVVQGRTYMIFLGTTFLLYFWFNFPLDKLIPVAIKLMLFVFISVLFMQALMPDYVDRMSYLFVQMFEVLQGKESLDVSANSRIFQSEVVYNHFERSPLSIFLGSGNVSNQWNNGYDSMFGHFYPSDIGLLGGLFVYGVVGAIFICLIPMVLTIRIIRFLSEENNVFIVTLKYLLIYTVIKFIQGSFYFSVAGYVIPLFILLAYIEIRERSNAR